MTGEHAFRIAGKQNTVGSATSIGNARGDDSEPQGSSKTGGDVWASVGWRAVWTISAAGCSWTLRPRRGGGRSRTRTFAPLSAATETGAIDDGGIARPTGISRNTMMSATSILSHFQGSNVGATSCRITTTTSK